MKKLKPNDIFSKINRLRRNYLSFSKDIKLCDVNHFECCVYLQDIDYALKELYKILDYRNSFDLVYKEIEFLTNLKTVIENRRKELSIVKIDVNFIFSEN